MWKLQKNADTSLNETTAKTLEELVDELVKNKQLTEKEKDIILGNEEKGIEAQYKITIGSRTIDFADELEFKEYMMLYLEGSYEGGSIREGSEVSVYFNYDTIARIKEEYLNRWLKEMEKTDEELYMIYSIGTEEQSFEEWVEVEYKDGKIDKKYATLREFALDSGATEEEYEEVVSELRKIWKDENNINNLTIDDVKILKPSGEETHLCPGGTFPLEIQDYIFKVRVREKEYPFRIAIGRYEIVYAYDSVGKYWCELVVDVMNKKCLQIQSAKVTTIDGTELEVGGEIVNKEDYDAFILDDKTEDVCLEFMCGGIVVKGFYIRLK